MWLGAATTTFARDGFHVEFIWLSSLYLLSLSHPRLSLRWPRLAWVNYFSKILSRCCFILGLLRQCDHFVGQYYFRLGLTISAVLSALDVVCDRHLSVRRLAALRAIYLP
jgi:hypothetical protein